MNEQVIWKQSWWDQVNFVRRNLINAFNLKSREDYDLLINSISVISVHTSKSIKLPVYKITYRGVKFILRNNFYDWKVSVDSIKPLGFLSKYQLFDATEKINACYCGGFDDSWVYGTIEENNQKFTVSINNDYDLYCFIKLIYSEIL